MSYPSYPGGAGGGYPQQPSAGGYPRQAPAPGYPGQPQAGGYPPQGGYGAPPMTTAGYPTQSAPAPYPSSAPQSSVGFAGAAAAVTAFQMPRAGAGAPAPYPGQPGAGYPPGNSAPYPGGPPMPGGGGAPYPGGAAAPYPGGAPAPYPGAPPANAPYPGAPPANAPYPGAPGANAPYPGAPGANTPYPGAPAANAPYPGAPPANAPYPGAPAANAPYPGAPAANAPYPGAPPAGAPYGGAPPAGSPYPPQGGSAPPQAQPRSYPTAQPVGGQGAQPPTAAMAGMKLAQPAGQPQAASRRRPSVKAATNFNKEADAQVLRKAMKGFGCDEKALITTLSRRSVAQRIEIRNHFKTMFGKDLMKEIESELHGHLESAVLALLRDPIEYDCYSMYHAMKGAGTNESALIEILCSRSNAQKDAIKIKYKEMYKKDLEKEVKSETSGNFERLLVSMLSATRDESTTVDLAKAKADAQTLYKAGEARWGTDESTFNYIFASRNLVQLKLIFEEYSKICKYDIEKSIQREMSGDLKDGMLAIVQMARDTPGFFAYRLYKSMKGLGTDDDALVRVIVTRCEVDMEDIKARFQQEYKKSLRSFIEGDTSGNYRRLLLTLINDGGY